MKGHSKDPQKTQIFLFKNSEFDADFKSAISLQYRLSQYGDNIDLLNKYDSKWRIN